MYDLNGNIILGYDIGGNQYANIESSEVERPIKTLDYSLAVSYGTKIDDSYNAFKNCYEEHPTAIPFFVQSDQHGVGINLTRRVNNYDVTDRIEFIRFQLGDYCGDSYSSSIMQTLINQSKYLHGFISCPGNHDYKGFDYTSTVDHELLKTAFTQDPSWYGCKWLESDFNNYTAIDVKRNLKMIVVDPYEASGVASNMPHPWYSTNTVTWIIDELTSDDGFDILYVQHEPIFTQYYTRNSPSVATAYSNNYASHIRPLLLARKNKERGTYTDRDGITHNYDFTRCTGELLMTIHGHTHAELYDTTGITCLTVPAGHSGLFGLIDKDAGYLRIWSFRYDNIYGELDIPLV